MENIKQYTTEYLTEVEEADRAYLDWFKQNQEPTRREKHPPKGKFICIGFDGTCVRDEFPKMGKDIGAVPVLRKLIENGYLLILFTMRSDLDSQSQYLHDAIKWFRAKGLKLYNSRGFNPLQSHWTDSRKPYADLYIDDKTLGIPLVTNDGKPYIDWRKAEKMLVENGFLT